MSFAHVLFRYVTMKNAGKNIIASKMSNISFRNLFI